MSRDPQKDLTLFTSTCDDIRQYLADAKTLKTKDGDHVRNIESLAADAIV